MFTGIVEGTGEIVDVEPGPDGRRLRIAADLAGTTSPGESVSVSGVCLTVEDVAADTITVFLAEETEDRTYLDAAAAGDAVNLEAAMRADGRLDGHFVQGHVDGIATVEAIESVGEDWRFTFGVPGRLQRYVVEKGSIALDGISLTVAAVDDEAGTIDVAIIPETYDRTTLSEKRLADPVHIEVDVLAKYVERLLDDGGGYDLE